MTLAGFAHVIDTTEHPVDNDWVDPTGIAALSDELPEGLAYVKEQRDDFRPRPWEVEWEHDLGDWHLDLASAQ